ncbi:energy-coupling factor ABC transporter permease [Pseudoxanthomonas mexicana]|uniref:energy-coupling factor ABC transporter permease n=1 Tax=Pseudoxanthomonas mexicana TaxID=128785 RepID=UPI00398A9631
MAWVQWLPAGVAVAVLAAAARRLPWYKLRGDAEAQRVLGIATAALILMRGFNTHGLGGAHLNFTCAVIATLMFGPRFALWALAAASLTASFFGQAWIGFGPDFIATALLPVLCSLGLSRAAERWLPPHLLIYVMVQAFLGGALAMLVCNLFKAAVAAWLDVGSAGAYLIATPLMMFGEGFLSGGTMALVVVYRPQWCASFDDARYLPPPR